MNQKFGPGKPPAEQAVENIRPQTRRHHPAEEKRSVALEEMKIRRRNEICAVGGKHNLVSER